MEINFLRNWLNGIHGWLFVIEAYNLEEDKGGIMDGTDAVKWFPSYTFFVFAFYVKI